MRSKCLLIKTSRFIRLLKVFGLVKLSIIQGFPQNYLRFSFYNFSAENALRILIFDIFQQLFPSAVENGPTKRYIDGQLEAIKVFGQFPSRKGIDC